MPTKPLVYRKKIPGWGTWLIAYSVSDRRWLLQREPQNKTRLTRTITVGSYQHAESAALAVAEGNTGLDYWDGLDYARGVDFDLSRWQLLSDDGAEAQ